MLENIRKVSSAQEGSLRISIPPALAANVGINAGGKVAVTIEKGKLIVSPISETFGREPEIGNKQPFKST